MKSMIDRDYSTPATVICDFYKLSHRPMYIKGMQIVSSTWTPRTSRLKGVDYAVHFGTQMALAKLHNIFKTNFFSRPKAEVLAEFARIVKFSLGDQNPDTSHLADLHDLGYLPLSVKSLPEGSVVPLRVPTLTIQNTDPRFFWLTNYVETFLSCESWQASTSATLAREYRKIMDSFAMETVGSTEFVMFQGHDFSMRGMNGLEGAINSGMGHITQFAGSDTVPVIPAAEYYYGANIEKELVATSIPATEHSIQCSYEDDTEYFTRMITEVHPNGFVSIVSDGRDFWDVIGNVIPSLKDIIMARSGGPLGDKVVIRPDSGDPVKIVCGDPEAKPGSLEFKGAIEALWDTFGGTVSPQGYKMLDSHIGLIYGDAITLLRCQEILTRLRAKGFASTNIVFGIGSYTYQYNTRDTLGYALKATACVANGKERMIFKDPKTDDGTKKSQRGRVAVLKDGNSFKMVDGLSLSDTVSGDQLTEVYRNGEFVKLTTLEEIRARLKNS